MEQAIFVFHDLRVDQKTAQLDICFMNSTIQCLRLSLVNDRINDATKSNQASEKHSVEELKLHSGNIPQTNRVQPCKFDSKVSHFFIVKFLESRNVG